MSPPLGPASCSDYSCSTRLIQEDVDYRVRGNDNQVNVKKKENKQTETFRGKRCLYEGCTELASCRAGLTRAAANIDKKQK